MTQLILLNNNNITIDIDEKFGIALEGNIQDIRDLEKVSGGSSKSLFITGNDETNTILGNLFNINFESQTFNIKAKQECELRVDNEILMRGFFQIANIQYQSKKQYTYEIWVFDEQINFFLELEENLISGNDDPAKDLDFSQYDHIWNYNNIEESWTKDAYIIPYYYALFNQSKSFIINVEDYKPGFYLFNLIEQIFYKYGYQFKSEFLQSEFIREIIIPFSTGDNLPSISNQIIEDRSFEADNGNCTNTQKAINSGELYSPSRRFPNFMGWSNLLAIGHSINNVFPKNRQYIPFNNVINEGTVGLVLPGLCTNDPDNLSQTARFTPLNQYTISSVQIDLEVTVKLRRYDLNFDYIPANTDFDGLNNFYLNIELFKVVNETATLPENFNNPAGVEIFIPVKNTIVNLGEILPFTNAALLDNRQFSTTAIIDDIEFEPNVRYFYTYSLQRTAWKEQTSGLPDVFAVDQTVELNFASIKNIVKKNEVREGDLIELNSWLPQNFKQKDLLKSVFKMFNLKMMPDPNNSKTLIIEPRDKFYGDGQIINANTNDNFYVLDKSSSNKLVTDFQAKEIIFKYADDSDSDDNDFGKTLLLDYKNQYKRTYGEQRILFDNENLRNTRVIELDFASTIISENTGQPWEDAFGVNQLKRYVTSMIESEQPKTLPRILFKNVIDIDDAIVESLGNRDMQVREYIFPVGQATNTHQGVPVKQTDLNVIATATHFRNNPFNPQFDLNFGRCFKYYYSPETLTDSNLYTTFWMNEISNIDKQKMLTANFYISPNQYKNLKYNTILYFDKNDYTNYYIINKIVEYNAKTGEAILELITYDPEQTFRIDKIELPIAFPADELPVDLAPNPNTGVVIGSDNIVNNPNVVIGNGNKITGTGNIISGPDNIVIGQGHTVNGSDNIVTGKKVNISGDNIKINSSAPVIGVGDNILYNGDVPAFLIGNTVVINEESIFYNGVDVLDFNNLFIDVTRTELINLRDTNELEPNAVYFITDRNIWLQAKDTNLLDYNGKRRQRIIKNEWYTPQIIPGFFNTEYLGVYGQTIDQGSVPVSDQAFGGTVYYAIWGGRMWERDTTGADVPGTNQAIINSGWTAVPFTDDNIYFDKIFDVSYDIDADFINRQRDDRNNIVKGITVNSTNTVDLTDWGNILITDNESQGIYNNWRGTLPANIIRNKCGGTIFFNRCGGIIQRNIILQTIERNRNAAGIAQNRCEAIINNGQFIDAINNNICTNRIESNNGPGPNVFSIEQNVVGGGIRFNQNNGRISINTTNGQIINNSANVLNIDFNHISAAVSEPAIGDNNNSGNIRENQGGPIVGNSNSGPILNNNCLIIKSNSNGGTISNNRNNGNINNNSNLSNINNNTNSGTISNNTAPVFSITFNDNMGDINNNSSNGSITLNKNRGAISNNTNVSGIFNISGNCNNGYISFNQANGVVCDIILNNNNGNIGAAIAPPVVRVATVSDTQVDK